jgi:hypothetical protein
MRRFLFPLAAGLTLATSLFSYGTGVWPGFTGSLGTASLELTRDLSATNASCGQCHNAFPGGGSPLLRVSVVVSRRAVQPGQAITITTSSTGGQTSIPPLVDVGGLCMDATAGTFVAGANTQVNPGATAITHQFASLSNGRSWTYGYLAPNQPGPVELYCVVNTANGDGQPTADVWGFNGFDGTAFRSTPVRLFVLAPGVTHLGDGCADGFGNWPVLGASQAPAIGNGNFQLELTGAQPNTLAFVLVAINPPGFVPLDLTPVGIPGCTAHVGNPFTNIVVTGPGQPQISEATASLTWPIPNLAALRGLSVQVQSCCIDQAALAIGRSLPLTWSNAIQVTVQ